MKHLKKFNESSDDTIKAEILNFCEYMEITKYVINEDLSVSIEQDVIYDLGDYDDEDDIFELTELPFTIRDFTGDLTLVDCGLTSLKGFPQTINGNFNCSNNELTSLEYGPTIVFGEYNASNNKLTKIGVQLKDVYDLVLDNNKLSNLSGTPNTIHNLSVEKNRLTTFEGSPSYIDNFLNVSHNRIDSFVGFPKRVDGSVSLTYNDITSLKDIQTIGGYYSLKGNYIPNKVLRYINKENFIKGIKEYNIWDNDIFNNKRFDMLIKELYNK